MEEDIKLNNTKPVRGFALVELFNEYGKKVLEEKTENTITFYETDRMKWRLKQDFYSGHPSSVLREPVYPLNYIILDSYGGQISLDSMLKNTEYIVGWADKTPYSGADTLRGTINIAESYTTNGLVHWVFDWATHSGNGTIQTIMWKDTTQLTVISSFASPDSSPYDLTWDGTNLWLAGDINSSIYKLNPNTGAVISSFASPDRYPSGLAWDGTNLWLAGNMNRSIYKLDYVIGAITKLSSPVIKTSSYTMKVQYDFVFSE